MDSVSRERVSAPTVTRSWITLTRSGRRFSAAGASSVRCVWPSMWTRRNPCAWRNPKNSAGSAPAGALMAKVSSSVAPARWARICSAMPREESGLMGPWHCGQNACATRGMSSFR